VSHLGTKEGNVGFSLIC